MGKDKLRRFRYTFLRFKLVILKTTRVLLRAATAMRAFDDAWNEAKQSE